MKNKKILIITGSFGNGHISVTNSIVNEFNRMNLDHLTVIQHDLFLEAHPVVTSILKKWYINSYKYFRNTYRMFYYSRPDEINKCFYKYYGLNRLLNLMIKEKPDLILLTFPTPVVSLLTTEFNLNIPIATVITDYNMHKNWITPESSRYYVAAEHTKAQLEAIGIESNQIQVTGIPINHQFDTTPDRDAWLTKHDLDPAKQTLLMVAGAFGVVEGFDTMLEELNDKTHQQFVVICGKSQKLVKQLQAKFEGKSNILIIGYSNDMSEWMHACDLMLTKPGGITISESLARAIPLVFFNPAPGQEGENAVFFTNSGFSRITYTMDETTQVIKELFNHPHELQTMKENMKHAYLPQSAHHICQDLIRLLNTSLIEQHIQSKAALYARLFAR